MDEKNKVFLAVGAVAIVAAAAIGAVKIIGNSHERVTTPASTTNVSQNTSAPTKSSAGAPMASAGSYKDGEYTAQGAYSVPGGNNSISIKLTIKDGKIAAVMTDDKYAERESSYYIDSFNSAIEGAVVGQPLDGLSLSRVGGASLTTQGFNQALDSIIASAKV